MQTMPLRRLIDWYQRAERQLAARAKAMQS
ncbi:MAG: hypothetical protein H6981_04430 [Gammaproteobacteria bacterium]|nr:hypothetical protein [Gammaproteobacteria bacterium]